MRDASGGGVAAAGGGVGAGLGDLRAWRDPHYTERE
jgi:hypothetical protein